MLEKLKQMLQPYHRLGSNKNLLVTGVAAVVITSAIIFSLWRSSQSYTALFGSQEHIPTAQVVEVLSGEAIRYRINPDNGQILVPEGSLGKARMALAAKGITATLPIGYELMDKESLLGSSQFIQNVRYKRSLEGELAQSVMALDGVDYARVHLGVVESSSFVINNKPDSSASVIIRLKYGQPLQQEQVGAIIQLVAGSVPGMNPANVRVVDQQGELLSEAYQAGNSSIVGVKRGTDLVKRLQTETEQNIANLLASIFGVNNYRISVVPRLNFSRVEETQERFAGDPHVSDENINQENTTNEMAMGIPGSLSNRPAAEAARQNPQALSSRNQAQRKYAYDRDIRHIRHPDYKLEKMSVAIVLNQAAPALANWTAEQLQTLNQLVEDAAGIDRQRGDSLTMNMMVFTAPSVFEEPILHWWQDPVIQHWAEMAGIGLLSLLLLLFGVKPLVQRFNRHMPKMIGSAANQAPGIMSEESDVSQTEGAKNEHTLAQAVLKSSFQENDNLPPQGSGLETKVEYLRMLAQSETERVAEVFKQWINSNERISTKRD